jgi:dihydrofolate reductase
MRRIVMFNWLTTDGYFAGPDGTLDWVVPEEEQAKAAARDIASFDTVLFGRRTYELFEGFWRHAADDSSTAPDPHRLCLRLQRAAVCGAGGVMAWERGRGEGARGRGGR